MSVDNFIHVLELGDDGRHAEWILYRLSKGKVLRLTLCPKLEHLPVRLYTNFPKEGEEFVRANFQELKFDYTHGALPAYSIGQRHTDLRLFLSGAFEFYFTYNDASGAEKKVSGCFMVEPELSINGKPLRLDAVSMQTVLTKNLGHVTEWESRLKVTAESGFNLLHFTPVQMLGQSQSSYSIANQLLPNPDLFDVSKGEEVAERQLGEILTKMEKEYGVISLTDVVWNHTADNSTWLPEHPEVGYNLENSPHLTPAYELDEAIMRFSHNIVKGFAVHKESGRKIPAELNNEDDLRLVTSSLEQDVIPQLRLWEYFVIPVDTVVEGFKKKVAGKEPADMTKELADTPEDSRFHYRLHQIEKTVRAVPGQRRVEIDLSLAASLYYVKAHADDTADKVLKRAVKEMQHALDVLNMPLYEAYSRDMASAVSAIYNAAKYQRLDGHGPRVGPITYRYPLAFTYFTRLGPSGACGDYNSSHGGSVDVELPYTGIMDGVSRKHLCANNGWIWGNSDPLKDFAAPGSKVYLRREVIIWGDCVKLRYGDKPEDCPFLWDFMKKYTLWTARHFHGIRIDNCHSTPRHVAQYMLDAARKIRPELYVMAELFTGSEGADNIFVNKLGISSLIREAMQAPDCQELGRLVHRYGGVPIGSFQPVTEEVKVAPAQAHALFMDCTHDNEPPIHKRTVQDTLPNAAIVSMSACAIGSNRGYDELVPHYIDVVQEKRLYAQWAKEAGNPDDHSVCSEATGMIHARKVINDLHVEMGCEGYSELYVDQVTSDVIFITRHNPSTRQALTLVAHSAFRSHPAPNAHIPPLKVWGRVKSIALEASISVPARRESINQIKTATERAKQRFHKDEHYINGLPGVCIDVKKEIPPEQSGCSHLSHYLSDLEGHIEVVSIDPYQFGPGSIMIVRTELTPESASALAEVNRTRDMTVDPALQDAVSKLSLLDLNYVLYRCDNEEKDENHGHGAYTVPNAGTLIYAGLQGVWSMLGPVSANQQLGHGLCDNLRQGNWLLGWIVDRLGRQEASRPLAEWLDKQFKPLKALPRYLIPNYVTPIIYKAYVACTQRAISLMGEFVTEGTDFIERLSLTSVQLYGALKSAPTRDPTLPPQAFDATGKPADLSASMAAGLPHFSSGCFRAWGRDTFIAIRGLMMVTGRFDDARNLLLGVAGTVRHGLVPNLLDSSRNPRFNCRDAVWFWLQALQDYCMLAPDGTDLLKTPISRLFPSDDISHYSSTNMCREFYTGPEVKPQPLVDLIQEIMQKHFSGIHFREWHAGDMIDRNMSDPGFNIDVTTDKETGIIYGGNKHNCGTWMDKMGESEKAGSRGVPGTPRDGADVEIIGMLKSTLRWLTELNKSGVFPHKGVKDGEGTFTYAEWNDRLQGSFEKNFYVPVTPAEDISYAMQPELVHRRGMYKDTVGSTGKYTDYQLRPNACIAMAVAPELFVPEHARAALALIQEVLLGPLGMRTLDPKDWAYRGDYDNSNDSSDFNIAKGLNYHQGPEWLWPVGYFLRAKLKFSADGKEQTVATLRDMARVLSAHYVHIKESPWAGLHELTNSNGKPCHHSCPTQAWSSSCLLDALFDAQALYRAKMAK